MMDKIAKIVYNHPDAESTKEGMMSVELSSERPRTVGEVDTYARAMVKNLHETQGGPDVVSPACMMARALNQIAWRINKLGIDYSSGQFDPSVEAPADLVDELFKLKAAFYDPYIS